MTPSLDLGREAESKGNEALNEWQQEACRGHLVPLRTKAEIDAAIVRTIEVYITPIPVKAASSILKAFDQALYGFESYDLHHLRRIVKPEHLPKHLKIAWEGTSSDTHAYNFEPLASSNLIKRGALTSKLYFLISEKTSFSISSLKSIIASLLHPSAIGPIYTISVPLNAAPSSFHARSWSETFWPTVYKGGNPNGPHPFLVSKAAMEMENDISNYMYLATKAGKKMQAANLGEPIGAVIVDRKEIHRGKIVCVAGDARYQGMTSAQKESHTIRTGNPLAHAVLRAIALVANKRLVQNDCSASASPNSYTSPVFQNFFADTPMNSLETEYFKNPNLALNGYLCLDLELYLTHEPCVMCSMAILHSRFGRVVFMQQMSRTGGLCISADRQTDKVEGGKRRGYGLWWREDLNWKALAWQWQSDKSEKGGKEQTVPQHVHA